jgi:phosphate uptake regulator
MIRRKVQLSGGLTYTVSLPKNWVREVGLKKGDEIILQPREDKALLLSLSEERVEREVKDTSLTIKEKIEPESLERLLISFYEAGYDSIRIYRDAGIADELREKLTSVLNKLSGLEVVEEDSNSVVLQSFLNVGDMRMNKTLERMEIILRSMISDLARAIEEKNQSILNSIIKRDDELDKFYSFLCKQVFISLKNKEVAEKIGFKFQSLILPYKAYGKCLENMGDIICLLSRITDFEKALSHLPLLVDSEEMLCSAVKAFKLGDAHAENEVVEMYSNFLSTINKLGKEDTLEPHVLLGIVFNNFCVEIIEISAQKAALEESRAN